MSATTVVSHLSLTRRDHTDGCDNSVSNLEGLGPKKLSKARVLVEVDEVLFVDMLVEDVLLLEVLVEKDEVLLVVVLVLDMLMVDVLVVDVLLEVLVEVEDRLCLTGSLLMWCCSRSMSLMS